MVYLFFIVAFDFTTNQNKKDDKTKKFLLPPLLLRQIAVVTLQELKWIMRKISFMRDKKAITTFLPLMMPHCLLIV